MRRFNEAIDEALTESMTRYTAMTDRYRDQFIGILGHDLRNPLNSIASGATLLTIRADADSTTANVASGMLRSAHRMGRLINDLLELTQARLGGEIPVKREQTDPWTRASPRRAFRTIADAPPRRRRPHGLTLRCGDDDGAAQTAAAASVRVRNRRIEVDRVSRSDRVLLAVHVQAQDAVDHIDELDARMRVRP